MDKPHLAIYISILSIPIPIPILFYSNLSIYSVLFYSILF